MITGFELPADLAVAPDFGGAFEQHEELVALGSGANQLRPGVDRADRRTLGHDLEIRRMAPGEEGHGLQTFAQLVG